MLIVKTIVFICTYRYEKTVPLDHKCTLSGCWYCENSCHICMERANQGYMVISHEEMFIHCSEDCKEIIKKPSQFSTVFPDLKYYNEGIQNLVLMQSEGCFASILSEHTVAQVMVCISVDAASMTYGRAFALVQLRTLRQHVFFSTYIANDFSPTQPVYNFPPGFSFELLKDNDFISQIVKMSLQDSEISTVSHLLTKATETDDSLSQFFSNTLSCEKYV